MITSTTRAVVQLLNNVLDEAVQDGADIGGAYYTNTENLDISINNLLYALDLAHDYKTKIIDNCSIGSKVKIVERDNAVKLLDFLTKE